MIQRYTVIIPTLNAAATIQKQIGLLVGQRLSPEEILIVDSSSNDGTPALVESMDRVRVLSVDRSEFDHGGTRDMAIRACRTPFFILLTQDALPMDDRMAEALLAPFEDERVAAVCGRQVAYPAARAAEKAIRGYRYPDASLVWEKSDITTLGMRAFLISDSCAAYRREAYDAVGGFEHPIMTNEDMLIAADLLNARYRLAYCAEARVWHSHDYTLKQEYERNRRIGCFLGQYVQRLGVLSEMGEGTRMVRAVFLKLLQGAHFIESIRFGLHCAARLAGNRAGRSMAKRMQTQGM